MPDELYSNDLEKWRPIIKPFLDSKLDEFHLLGLNHLKMDEFWQFVKASLEKKKEDRPGRLHEVVAAVMALTVNDYMDKLRVDLFKSGANEMDSTFLG
ncbi:post-transcriptional regulator [Sporolactobacillus sp. CPB3-1]|uniref:Post-transcriptional regulator n=1 Tax=Sporolactobacillus mangiferae TaxID=2940498 RepID=A0ABT0M6M4_9BACL|nr:post-transcriptional regulator [Sporolactobacillus mangiferae]MCL1630489.1 post-transcriptional regulator [Sporolactobacillus mangiferae]